MLLWILIGITGAIAIAGDTTVSDKGDTSVTGSSGSSNAKGRDTRSRLSRSSSGDSYSSSEEDDDEEDFERNGMKNEHLESVVTGHGSVLLEDGREMAYDIQDGYCITEGDIIVGFEEDLIPVTGDGNEAEDEDGNRRMLLPATSFHYRRWNRGIVPFVIDGSIGSTVRSRINAAINHWRSKTGLTFVPRNGQRDFVRFVNGNGCSSWVGRQGGAQVITLSTACSTGNTIHEIGHAIGFHHTHSREDRNSFVAINYANIQQGTAHNFNQVNNIADDCSRYDYGSIMHYGKTAFAVNPNIWTVIPIPNPSVSIGQRSGLSNIDVACAHTMYFHRSIISGGGNCLDVHAPDLHKNGARIQGWDCNNAIQQQWFYNKADKTIMSESGNCLDVHLPDYNSRVNGAKVQLWNCHNRNNQKFIIDGGSIRSLNGKCLDIHAPDLYNNGGKVQLWDCNRSTPQRWYMPILNSGGNCIDIHAPCQYNIGCRVQSWACNNAKQQSWYYNAADKTIRSASGLCLDVHRPHYDARINGADIQVWSCHGGAGQRFTIEGNAIKSSNGKCLDIHAPDLFNNGAKVQLWDCNGSIQQSFTF